MENLACAFTGHRKISHNETERLREVLFAEIEELFNSGYKIFYAGGAFGFDALCSLTVIGLKEKYPDIELRLILPCPNQDRNWNLRERHEFKDILDNSDSFEYVSETYSPASMQKRNMELINRSHLCLCYLNSKRSGTGFTVKYAKKRGIAVKNLYINK